MEAIELAHKVVEVASDKQAMDIILLDTREACNFTDYFVICSGDSARQIEAIYEEVAHALKKEGILPLGHEGTTDSGWMLIDFGDVIVHIFAPAEREFYKLDKLWNKAVPVVRVQ